MNVKLLSMTQNPLETMAYAASRCYMSEPRTEIVKHCWESGHCYDEETEVLTDKGFIKWKDINYDTYLATINPENRVFNGFEKPLALIRYPYKGKMIKFETKDVDLMITPEHKLYCSLNSTQYKRTHPEFELLTANQIVGTINKYKAPVYKKPLRLALTAINNDLSSGDIFYKLYGFFIGDGYSTGKGSFVSFHLKKERKIKYLKQICQECGIKIQEKTNNKYNVYVDPAIFRALFYNKDKEKTFPLSFLKMSKENFDYFFDGLINSDGNVHKTGLRYDTTSKELKERLTALFSINNVNHTISYYKNLNENQKDRYTFNISNNSNKYPMFNDSRSKNYATEVDYDGMVYCAETSTGLLVVRRNDKICLCGNCSIAEHAYFTFEITGVSRSLLAQLTRHRLASYSVTSQRYVDMKDYDMIIPHEIDNNPAAKEIFNKAIDATRDCYKELQELDIKNEDARAVLPNACSTNLVMTINLRSLSNFMNERLCTRAQDEIRQLAKLMKEAVLSENCWGDFKEYLDKRILVPKCEKNKVKFCPERKSCGRQKTAKEINEIISKSKEDM